MTVDSRGLRFAAWLTTAVLVVVLVTGSGWLLLAQSLVFALGAFFGLRRSPYGLLFRYVVAPRLGPPRESEPEAPPRFAQLVGLLFGLAGTVGYLLGAPLLGAISTSAALAAAFLNAAFGFCLGCEIFLLLRRATRRTSTVPTRKQEGAPA
ncbi:MAG: DUF4395 domain-containing protein [Geodermatophilaceae bacterium]|nr:DUF4395 domain-containing protein [Geodermatophilaceae bacterium]MDQ3456127.1 DUF4395 domain-containing protein [Actinomycetota bacterium]